MQTTGVQSARKPALLAGGNPQIAKADGDAPVQAYIAAMPGWKRDVGRRLDALIVRTVPDVRKAVKWNSPFYGIEGRGWFLSVHCFTKYVKVAFLPRHVAASSPPGESKQKDVRYLDIHEDDPIDEKQLAAWIKQGSRHPRLGRLVPALGSQDEKAGHDSRPSASELISQRIAELSDWRGKPSAGCASSISAADPAVVEEWKWMNPVWSHDGIICTGESYKKAVKLTFAKGASLKDPARLFNSSLDGNVRRAIDIHEGEDDRRVRLQGALPPGGRPQQGEVLGGRYGRTHVPQNRARFRSGAARSVRRLRPRHHRPPRVPRQGRQVRRRRRDGA